MDDSFENWLKERAPETDADDGRLSPGTVIGAYRVETFLGKGGFAEVYSAKASNGERVAIKILHRLDDQSRMRFERESNILSQIHHPNIPKLLSFGSCGNRPYLVMEMLQAKELPHSDKAVATFIKAVCRAADALHKMGYVHRDIKPSNVLWRGDTPVLIDFGLACLKTNVPRSPSTISIVDGQRIVVGTMGYAAPEQFAGGMIDEDTDVHAIGMLADKCFNGKPPRCWSKIIDRATNSRNAVRYATALDLAKRISCRHIPKIMLVVSCLMTIVSLLYAIHLGMIGGRKGTLASAEKPVEIVRTQEVYRVVKSPVVIQTQEVFRVAKPLKLIQTQEVVRVMAVTNVVKIPVTTQVERVLASKQQGRLPVPPSAPTNSHSETNSSKVLFDSIFHKPSRQKSEIKQLWR